MCTNEKKKKNFVESEPWRLPDPTPTLCWLALVPPALSEAASRAGVLCSVSLPPPPITSG